MTVDADAVAEGLGDEVRVAPERDFTPLLEVALERQKQFRARGWTDRRPRSVTGNPQLRHDASATSDPRVRSASSLIPSIILRSMMKCAGSKPMTQNSRPRTLGASGPRDRTTSRVCA